MPPADTPSKGRDDTQLIAACLRGDGEAWNDLVERYKRLVFSVILKYGANREEAADLFQGVWLDAYNDLAKLRNPKAFKGWLVSLTQHKCYHWKRKLVRTKQHEVEVENPETLELAGESPAFVEDLERQQLVREAMTQIPERCQTMIRLLFFTIPPKPYDQIAERLGLATGSIGFIRGRCLKKLQKALEKLGL